MTTTTVESLKDEPPTFHMLLISSFFGWDCLASVQEGVFCCLLPKRGNARHWTKLEFLNNAYSTARDRGLDVYRPDDLDEALLSLAQEIYRYVLD